MATFGKDPVKEPVVADARKARAVELAKKGALVGAEIDEFAGLSKEYPESVKAAQEGK